MKGNVGRRQSRDRVDMRRDLTNMLDTITVIEVELEELQRLLCDLDAKLVKITLVGPVEHS